MGITVGENAEFSPRQRILPNAYAYRAKVAESVDGLDGGLILGGTAVTASATELNYLDNAHKGTVAANKGVVVDEHKDAKGFRNLQASYLDAAILLARDRLVANGSAELNGRLDVEGNALFKGHVDIKSNLYVGDNNQGVDVQFFGRNGARMLWDESHNNLVLATGAKLYVNGNANLAGGFDARDGTINGTLDVNGLLDVGPLTVQNPFTEAEVNIRATTARANDHDPAFAIQRKEGWSWIKAAYGPGPTNFASDTHHFEIVTGYAWKPGGGDWGNPSDERLKKNIKNLDGALDKLLKLRSVTYEYKDPKHRYYLAGKQTGFIAQEVEEVFPEWVSPLPFGPDEDEPDLKGVSVTGFPALSVQALRELRAEKDAQIEALKEANSALETRLARLEALLERQGSGSIKESR